MYIPKNMRKVNNFEQVTPTPVKKLFEKYDRVRPTDKGYLGDNVVAPMNTTKIEQMVSGESLTMQEMTAQERSQAVKQEETESTLEPQEQD